MNLPVIRVETITTLRGLLLSYQYDPISPHQAKLPARRMMDEGLLRLIDAGIGEDPLDAVDEDEARALRAAVHAGLDADTADDTIALLHAVMRFGAEQLAIPECRSTSLPAPTAPVYRDARR